MLKRYPLIGWETSADNAQQVGKSVDLTNAVLFLKTYSAGIRSYGAPCDVWTIMKFGEGNLEWTLAKDVEYEGDRKKLDDVTQGAESPLEVTLEGKLTFTASMGNEPATVHEIVTGMDFATGQSKFAGTAEPWLSSYGCPPYACELELHLIPQLECPTVEIPGEAHLFRFFRAPSIGWNISSKRTNCRGAAHVVAPRIIRPDFFSIYSAEIAANEFHVTDCVPLPEDAWVKDQRDHTPSV